MAQLSVDAVISAATHLQRAAQWTAATNLLCTTSTDDPAERRALALSLAEVAVDQDFAQKTDNAADALTAATQAVTTLPDATITWDIEMLRLRKDYGTELFREAEADPEDHRGRADLKEGDGQAAIDPADGDEAAIDPADREGEIGQKGRGRTVAAGLGQWADRLQDQAPDDARRGMASFYAGLIADNLHGKSEDAFAYYTTALELGERSGDDLLSSLALRHLGDHAHTAGDLKLARQQWERSTELRQKVGHLFGALAQQALLSVLLRDEGDPAGSRALATEVNRWSRQLDFPHLTAQTTDLAGQS